MPVNLSPERLRAGLVIALLVCAVLALLQWQHALQRFEWIAYDQRMQFWRADKPLHPDVAVVLIDEQSLAALKPVLGRFPWPRSVYADIIDFFHSVGARAVVFDILFAEQERNIANDGLTDQDRAFIAAAQNAGNVYHAAEFWAEPPDENGNPLPARPLPETLRTRFAVAQARDFPDRGLNDHTAPLDDLLRTSRGVGGVSIDPDADGVFRRVNLFFNYDGTIIASQGVVPLLERLQGPIRFTEGAVRFGDLRVPLDANGHYLVNMAGQIRPDSFASIYETRLRIYRSENLENLPVNPYDFENKIVFIGANAVGLQDLKTTALAPRTPGVYIHASVMSNLLQQDFLQPTPTWATALITAVLVCATVFAILASSGILAQFTVTATVALLYGLFAVWTFGHGLAFDVAAPFTGIGLAVLSTFSVVAFTEGRDKRRVRAMFSRYVSPEVLEEVVGHYKDQLQAEVGRREHLSILFSDVRGFTSLSEKLDAEQVVDLLNVHFSVMGEIIFRYKGTLDKFIGDAIMAFWGAPIPVADHARRAVYAAMEMSRQLTQVNEELAARGYPSIDVGIGINTGDVVLGNIGSERKLDYTIIGDHVNLGSRLEGLTKQYHCRVLISEYTYQELGGEIPCEVVDLVRVKGKQMPIRIYSPLALPEDSPADRVGARSVAELSERAFSAYLSRRFEEAGRLYAQLPESCLRDLFIGRCGAYRDHPPASDWDGVCNITTK